MEILHECAVDCRRKGICGIIARNDYRNQKPWLMSGHHIHSPHTLRECGRCFPAFSQVSLTHLVDLLLPLQFIHGMLNFHFQLSAALTVLVRQRRPL